jgi:hypothetical protein
MSTSDAEARIRAAEERAVKAERELAIVKATPDILKAAEDAGFTHPKAAALLVAGSLQVDASGQVTNIQKALADLAMNIPHLVRRGSGRATADADSPGRRRTAQSARESYGRL